MTHMVSKAEDQKRIEARISADYILHDPNFPRGYTGGIEYNEQRVAFDLKSGSRDAVQLTKGALELYYNSNPKHVTFSSNVTWDDVSQTSKEARTRENKKKDTPWNSIKDTMKNAKADYGSKGRLRKAGRSLGDIAPAIVHKLDFAPDQMYVNIVCQGLKFVFDVAIQLANKRKKILDAFENIPELIRSVHAYDKFFDRNPDYVILRDDFDVCLLTAIAKSIQWLAKPPIWKLIEVLIQGPLAARSVDDLMDDVQVKRSKLDSQMDFLKTNLLHYISKDTESGVRQNDSLLVGQKQMKALLDGTSHGVRGIADDIEHVADKVQEIGATIDAMHLQQERDRVKALQDALNNQVLCNEYLVLFCERMKDRGQSPTPRQQQQQQQHHHHHQEIEERKKKPEVARPVLHQGQLTSFMAVNNNHLPDILSILEGSARFDIEEMKLAYAIASSTDIEDFLDASRGILFLNGSGDITLARESPISASLASLVFGITQGPQTVVLHFFCGLHSETHQAISGPSGLLRSLIAQLSLKYDFDLDFINDAIHREKLREHDLRMLCETFSAMVSQLPADCELYCIIDGISWLDTPRWREELVTTVAYICYLSADPHCQARFKVLISSPVRSLVLTHELRHYGGLANVVEVQSIRVTERDMPTGRELAEMTRR